MNWDLILTATGINKILLIKLNLDYILSKEIFSQTGRIKGHQMIFPEIFLCSCMFLYVQTKVQCSKPRIAAIKRIFYQP